MAFKYLNDATIGAGQIVSNILPSAANVAEGTFAYDSTVGPVYAKGSQWLGIGSTVFTPTVVTNSVSAAAANWTAIAAAIVGAALVGGTVQLPPGRIITSAPIQLLSGVQFQGVPPQLVFNTIPDSGLTSLVGSAGGTVIVPNGAFDAMAWNLTALGAPASQTAFSNTALTNIAIKDIGFSGDLGGIWAIHCGATNNASAWYSKFINIYATGFTALTGGGFSFTNYQHCQFTGNYTFGCQWGQLHQIDVAAASLAPGNSTYYDIYSCNPVGSVSILTRSVSFITTATTGGAANNNEFKFDRMQSNRFGGVLVTQAATMVNTQANITITDGTKYAVGLPVSVDATQNGFTLKKIYFVISVAANVIQLSNTYGGAAVTATGSTAVNIVHSGFPCFEMIALSGSTNTNVVMDNVDVEGFGTVGCFFQNCNGVNIQMSQVPGTTQATQSLCFRGCANKFVLAPQSINKDDDQNALNPTFFVGAHFGTPIGYQGIGLYYDSVSLKASLSLGNQFDSPSAGAITFDPATGGGFMAPRVAGLGEAQTKVISGSVSITNLNLCYLNTTGSAVITLPSVVAANQGAWLSFFNNTGATQTINTDGVQLYNNVAARTGLTLNDKASVHLKGMSLNGTFTWVITGGSSAMVAGVISAPS